MTTPSPEEILRRLREVRQGIEAAATQCGRRPNDIALIAVSKRHTSASIACAYDAGVRCFGESTWQELRQKTVDLAQGARAPQWHFVGRLQTNKAKLIGTTADVVHSVDRSELLDALAQGAEARSPGHRLQVLLQVNVAAEPQKGGVSIDGLERLARQCAASPNLRLRGLMTVPPATDDPSPHFERLRYLLCEVQKLPYVTEATELSMGMSGDYACAITHGATMVRIGSAIFSERAYP